MSRKDIESVLKDAKPGIAKFWSSCRESGLRGHGEKFTGKVDRALEAYIAALTALPERPTQSAILDVMKSLFSTLDDVNREARGGLLETDERELLVPVIIDAAAAAGLDVKAFPDGDPTVKFRNF
jgi:hypothetical protein